MFEITQVFHVSHVVDDLDASVAWYEKVFAPRVWQNLQLGPTRLALLVIGDTVLMPMAPVPGIPSSPARFHERFGQHLHSLALYVDEPVELIEHLRGLGLRLTGSSGAELEDPKDEIWTQPRESPVVLELFQPRESMEDPRHESGWSSAYWREEHPLRIQDSWYTVVADDLDGASRFFGDALHAKVVHDSGATVYGTRSRFVAMGDAVVLEIAQPLDGDSAAARDLADRTPFHAVTFRVADLARAVAHVEAQGIGVTRAADGHAALEPADTLGVQFRLTDEELTSW
jgi:catechol 2,3-dioxygenase-like lactoylglutathione lyase family enzyme